MGLLALLNNRLSTTQHPLQGACPSHVHPYAVRIAARNHYRATPYYVHSVAVLYNIVNNIRIEHKHWQGHITNVMRTGSARPEGTRVFMLVDANKRMLIAWTSVQTTEKYTSCLETPCVPHRVQLDCVQPIYSPASRPKCTP